MEQLLNPYQKSALKMVLRQFEEDLRQAEAWLDNHSEEGILYRRQLHLKPQHRAQARQYIANALEDIALLARKISLEQEAEDPAGLIRSQMSIAWTNLNDTLSRKLKRYGSVHSEVSSALDPQIKRLAQAALALASLFEKDEPTPACSDAENFNEMQE